MSQINFPLEKLRYREPGVSDYIIVGQQPSGNDPDEPLSTANPIWSGARLARMANLPGDDFERHFRRVNINYNPEDKFRVNAFTRARAQDLWSVFRANDRVILLGSAVEKCFAGLLPEMHPMIEGQGSQFTFGLAYSGFRVAVVPHPSGLNRWYNDPSNIIAVGQFLRRCYEGGWREP